MKADREEDERWLKTMCEKTLKKFVNSAWLTRGRRKELCYR